MWIAGWLLFIFVTLVSRTLRRNFEAGLLLIPLLLSMVGITEPIFTTGMTDWGGHPYRSPLTLQAGPIPIHFASIADFTGLLVIVLIIFVPFLRIHRNQERAASELAAARSVQELMIPQEKLETPALRWSRSTRPLMRLAATSIMSSPPAMGTAGRHRRRGRQGPEGGHERFHADGRSAQDAGTKSCENLGVAQPRAHRQRKFHHLSGGVVRSQWRSGDGQCRSSAPYLNSQEVAIPGGLPLGVLPEVSYEEFRLYLHPGDRLLLLSDGVVEARQPSGELFGFARVHNLSSQSAFYIAEAAKAFGQEDDITVLTVRRLAQALAA